MWAKRAERAAAKWRDSVMKLDDEAEKADLKACSYSQQIKGQMWDVYKCLSLPLNNMPGKMWI